MKDRAANEAARFLLRGKTWRYLRYLHLREYVAKIAHEIGTICVCGAGHGLAEFLIAREFQHINVTVTDIIDPDHGYPNFHRAMDLAWRHNVRNINFSVWDVLVPTKRRFDLVCSTEMLEHISDDDLAARNMKLAANKYVYCLVPFADEEFGANQFRQAGVFDRHGHFVVGYSTERLCELFPDSVAMAGAYWHERGRVWRDKMECMTVEEIEEAADVLKLEAFGDLIDRIPYRSSDCQAIKVLARITQ